MQKRKSEIYTANFGGRDIDLHQPNVYYYKEDTTTPQTAYTKSKYLKVMNPDKFELWLDANIEVVDEKGLFNLFKNCDIGLIKHPERETIWQELQLLKTLKLITKTDANRYTKYVRNSCTGAGLYCGGIIYRHYSSDENIRLHDQFANKWWGLINTFSYRDQLTLPLVVKEFRKKLKIKIVDLDIYDNKLFKIHPHKND